MDANTGLPAAAVVHLLALASAYRQPAVNAALAQRLRGGGSGSRRGLALAYGVSESSLRRAEARALALDDDLRRVAGAGVISPETRRALQGMS